MNSDRMILKAKAINYFQQSGIPKAVENSLNDLFKLNPTDSYGYLSTYFEKLTPLPTVSRIKACKCTGDFGCHAITVTIFGVFRNEEIVLSKISMPNNVTVNPGMPLTSNYISTHNATIDECIVVINDTLSNLLVGLDPCNTEEISRILRSNGDTKQAQYEETLLDKGDEESRKEEVKGKTESAKKSNVKKGAAVVVIPDDPPEIICPLLRAHSAVSLAMAAAASKITKRNFSECTIEQLRLDNEIGSATLPMVSLLRNGKGLPGKCQWIKRCLLIPNGLYDNSENICTNIRLICLTVACNLQAKAPVATISEYGELLPAFDRADQFLDAIQEAMKQCEMEEKFRVVVEVDSRGIFDMDKGKYEAIAGQMKSGEEFVAMMVDLVERYPIIVGLVDPLRTQDKEMWRSLSVSVSGHCWVMGRYPHSICRAAKIVSCGEVQGQEPVSMSVMCLAVDGYSLYEDYLLCYHKLKEQGQMTCLWLDDLCAEDWLVDLALGLQVAIVAIPGPRCLSGAAKIDRWNILAAPSSTNTTTLSFPEIYHQSEPTVLEETVAI